MCLNYHFKIYLMKVIQYINGLPKSGVKPNDISVLLVHLVAQKQLHAGLARDEGQASHYRN